MNWHSNGVDIILTLDVNNFKIIESLLTIFFNLAFDVHGSRKRSSQHWRWLGRRPTQCWWWRQRRPLGCVAIDWGTSDKFRLVRFFCGRMAPFLCKFTRLSSSELLWALKLRGWCIGLDGCVSQGRGLGYCCQSGPYLSKWCTVYWTLLKTQSVFQCEESKLIQIEID